MHPSTDPPPFTLVGARPWGSDEDAAAGPVDVQVAEGRIVAVVPSGSVAPVGRSIDVDGAWIGSGFVDAHVHLVMAGLGLRQVDLSGCTDRAAFAAAIEAGADVMRRDGAADDEWLLARGWDESQWGGQLPDSRWLEAAGGRPAAAWRMDIHAAVVNAAGMARLDLREPVPGGRIVRDAAGRPTGLLTEAAAWQRLVPALPDPTPAQERDAVRKAVAHAHARGLVAVGSMEYLDVIERAIVPLADDLTLAVRLLALDRALPLDVPRLRALPASPAVRLFAVKAFVDGTLGSRTARMLDPYADAGEDDRGLFVELALDGTLWEWARSAAAADLGLAIHAIGDEAVRLALDALDAADGGRTAATIPRPHHPRPHLHRIEHAQHVHAADLPRFAGRFASMQPGHRIVDRGVMDARLGSGRATSAFPFAELAAAGAILAFGSDWPVIDCDPIEAIAAAVAGITREGPRPDGHEIGVRAAVRAHTVDAWRAIDEPDRGRVVAGAPADLVLLDRGPGAVDWSAERPRVLMTVASGRVVFDGSRADV